MSEDEEGEDESDADGFVVPNGYVSESEGVDSAQASLGAVTGEPSEGAPLLPESVYPSVCVLICRVVFV